MITSFAFTPESKIFTVKKLLDSRPAIQNKAVTGVVLCSQARQSYSASLKPGLRLSPPVQSKLISSSSFLHTH